MIKNRFERRFKELVFQQSGSRRHLWVENVGSLLRAESFSRGCFWSWHTSKPNTWFKSLIPLIRIVSHYFPIDTNLNRCECSKNMKFIGVVFWKTTKPNEIIWFQRVLVFVNDEWYFLKILKMVGGNDFLYHKAKIDNPTYAKKICQDHLLWNKSRLKDRKGLR